VASGILLSRISGLVRERVFAHYFGSGDAAGAFKAAARIPNFLQNLFGEGVLSASFIPVYARLLAEGKTEEAGRVASVVASLLTLSMALLVGLGTLAALPLIDVIAPGFEGDVRILTAQLVQIMFPGVGLLVLSAWCLGVLNSHRRFFLSYVAPVLWNIAVIATLIALGAPRMSARAGQMDLARLCAWATVAGAALQLGMQLPQAIRLVGRGHFRPSLALRSEAVQAVLHNFVPVVVSRGVVQLSAYIDQYLANGLGTQAVAALAYAQTLYLLPISLFGMSVSAAELPEMSREIGVPDEVAGRLRERLGAARGRIAFFVVPSLLAFLALGDVVVATLFQSGAFRRSDTVMVWIILAGSTVGLLAATQGRLLSSACYALRDARTPLRCALLRVVLTGLGGWACVVPLKQHFGWSPMVAAAGLTASAGVAGWIEFLLLGRSLKRRIGHVDNKAGLILRLWLCALGAAAVARGLVYVLPPLSPVLVGLLGLGVYGVLYLGATVGMGLPEARSVLGPILRRLRR
jgi:putative peptidoglycan lipid II flippase